MVATFGMVPLDMDRSKLYSDGQDTMWAADSNTGNGSRTQHRLRGNNQQKCSENATKRPTRMIAVVTHQARDERWDSSRHNRDHRKQQG